MSALPEAIAAARTRRTGGLAAAQGHSAGRIDVNGGSADPTPRSGPNSVIRSRSRERCVYADGPITIIAGEQVARDDARVELEQLRAVLRARVATVPDAKDVAGTPGWDPRRRSG